jgi:gingipain R
MKKLLLLVAFFNFILFVNAKSDYDINLISSTSSSVKIEFILKNYQLVNAYEANGVIHQKINVDGGVSILQKNCPDLLKFTSNIQLPNRGMSSVLVLESDFTDLNGIEISPSKGNLYRNIDPSKIPYVKGAVYTENNFFPKLLADLNEPYIHRDIRGQTVNFIPFQYHPIQKKLRVFNRIVVEIHFDIKKSGVNQLYKLFPKQIPAELENIYLKRYLNYSKRRYNSIGEDGSILIISPNEYFSQLDTIIEWKRKAGYKVELVDISTIGNTQNNIYNYVRDYYQQNPDFLYLLLVGDHNKVAAYNAGNAGSEIKWSDAKYGLISNSNDWYPDIYVGRFSPSSTSDLQIMIDRNMEYEITPDTSDYYKKAIGLGSNEGAGFGDDGEADWLHLRNIRTDLLNFGYTQVHEFYDGTHGGEDDSGNPNSAIISPAVNEGISLFNYTGHGDQNTCITGNYSSTHINSATNNGKYPLVISVACNNGTFTSGTCISEAWQRASNLGSPTGAIAAAGSTILMSWAPPMSTQDEIVDILVESYPNNRMHTLGGLFYSGQMDMLDDYPQTGKEVIETWVFFGDPSVLFRSDVPQDMDITHVPEDYVGISSLTVSSSIENATVTLLHMDSVIGTSKVLNGEVVFNFDTINNPDSLEIVANAYNHIPYFGKVYVIEEVVPPSGALDFAISPNPVESDFKISLSFELDYYQEVNVRIYNPIGQLIYDESNGLSEGFYGPSYNPFEISLANLGLSSGVYTVNVELNNKNNSKHFIIPQ